jgi:predicted  nucleic acid-binding Zn-ribbon protein
MPNGKTKAELQLELDDANERIEELESKLEDIMDIADFEDPDKEDDSPEDEDPDDLD